MQVKIQAESTQLNARRALDSELYFKDEDSCGAMFGMLELAAKYSECTKFVILIATIEDKDVGVCVVSNNRHLNVFVKQEYRGNKVGEQLIHKALEITGLNRNTCYASIGDDLLASMKFWKRLNIYVDHFEPISKKRSAGMNIDKYVEEHNRAMRDGLRLSLISQGFDSQHILWDKVYS